MNFPSSDVSGGWAERGGGGTVIVGFGIDDKDVAFRRVSEFCLKIRGEKLESGLKVWDAGRSRDDTGWLREGENVGNLWGGQDRIRCCEGKTRSEGAESESCEREAIR